MKRLTVIFSILLLCSCATTAKYEKILNSYMGQSKATLVTNWGVPSGTYQLDEKTELLKYSTEQYIGNGKYWCDTTFTITDGVVSNWKYNGNACRAK